MKTSTMKTLIHAAGRSLGRILRGAVFATALLGLGSALLGSALLGCSNPLAPEHTGGIGPDQGRLTIAIGVENGAGAPAASAALAANAAVASSARTLVPEGLDSTAFNRYEVAWSGHATEAAGSVADYTPGKPITLKTGAWKITVTAYTGTGAAAKAAAQASDTITINPGDSNTLPLTLAPFTGDGAVNGALSYTISFPSTGLDSATVTITTAKGVAVEGGDITASAVQLAAGTLADAALPLPAGQYLLKIKLLAAGGTLSAGKTVGLHIYPTLTTIAPPYAFTTDDLVVTYAVSFTANGGTPAPATQYIAHGEKATKPTEPALADNAFGGWYADAALGTPYNFDSAVTADKTLYAKWTPLSRTPAATTASLALPAADSASLAFPLSGTAYDAGAAWAVYDTASGATTSTAATVAYAAGTNTVTLTKTGTGALASGAYYVGVTESGKAESARLTLTVSAYVAPEATPLPVISVSATVAKTSADQTSVSFTLTNGASYVASGSAGATTWKGYNAATGGGAYSIDITLVGSVLTLDSYIIKDLTSATTFYLTATNSGKAESTPRVAVTVTPYIDTTTTSRVPTAAVTTAVKTAAGDASITVTLNNDPEYADSDAGTPANGTRWIVQHPTGGTNNANQLTSSTAGLTVTNLGNAITITKSGGALAAGPYYIAAIEPGKAQHAGYLLLTVREAGGGSMGGGINHTLVGGVLTITGTGPMPDFSYGAAPWYDDRADITSIVVSSGITRVGNAAFYATAAATVSLPEGLLTIGEAFGDMDNLVSIHIPSTVTKIVSGSGYVYSCFPLYPSAAFTGFTVDAGNANYAAIDDALYGKTDGAVTTLYMVPRRKTGAFEIPDGVTTLDFNCFASTLLSTIDIPASVTTLMYNFIAGTTPNLTDITVHWSAPPAPGGGFTQRGNITLHVPYGTAGLYATSDWTGFKDVVEQPAATRTPAIAVASDTVNRAADAKSAAFTLTGDAIGIAGSGTTWQLYTTETGSALHAGVSAVKSGSTLTLKHDTNLPATIAGTSYWVSAQETGKDESPRAKLVVQVPSAAVSFTTVTYWTSPADTDLVTSAAGSTIDLSRSGAGGVPKTVTITAKGEKADYTNRRFSINGGDWVYGNEDDEQSYFFTSAGRGNGNYNLEVRVQRTDDGKWYSGVVKITVKD